MGTGGQHCWHGLVPWPRSASGCTVTQTTAAHEPGCWIPSWIYSVPAPGSGHAVDDFDQRCRLRETSTPFPRASHARYRQLLLVCISSSSYLGRDSCTTTKLVRRRAGSTMHKNPFGHPPGTVAIGRGHCPSLLTPQASVIRSLN